MNPIKNISINSKKLKLIDSFIKISPEAEKLMSETKEDKMLSTLKNLFLWEPIKNILILEFYQKGSLKDAKDSQNRMLAKLDDFKRYNPKKPEIIEGKKAILTDKEKLYD